MGQPRGAGAGAKAHALRERCVRLIPVPQAAKESFNAMKPDFDALAKYEEKVERLADRLEERENGLEVEEVINVMGSTAGAGDAFPMAPFHLPCPAAYSAPDWLREIVVENKVDSDDEKMTQSEVVAR